MPAITVKNIPDKLYKKLKKNAALHRRSINSEIIYCIEKVLKIHPFDKKVFALEVDEMRKSIKAPLLTEKILRLAKEKGRP
jgi:plasmid stability protein